MKLTEIQDLIKFVEITIKSDPDRKKGAKGSKSTEAYIQQPMQMMPQMMPQQMQQPIAATAPAPAPVGDAKKDEKTEEESKYIVVKSPMIGTFYRSPSPDKDPFLSVGDNIKPGKIICIIEAMKLFNEIEAEMSGKIVKVLAEDASPVEYDQPLFLVDPS